LAAATIVSFFNLLEHITNPVGFLGEIVSHMQPGSFVVVETPRHPSLSSFNNKAFPQLSCRHIYPPDHLHVFSCKSTELLLKKANLVLRGTWSYGQDAYDLLSCALAGANLPQDEFTDRVFDLAAPLQRVIDQHDFSDTMLWVAQKAAADHAAILGEV